MKRGLFIIVLVLSLAFIYSGAAFGAVKVVTQEDLAKMIGKEMDYKGNYMDKLTKAGVTPPGGWDAKKPLTAEDFDGILIRMTRRDPATEKKPPSILLDQLGFPPRGVSQKDVKGVLNSIAFRRTTINSKLLMTTGWTPLPARYKVFVTENMLPNVINLTQPPNLDMPIQGGAAEAIAESDIEGAGPDLLDPDFNFPPEPIAPKHI